MSTLRSGCCSAAVCRGSQAEAVHLGSGCAGGEEKVGLRQARWSEASGEVTMHAQVMEVCDEGLQGSGWASYKLLGSRQAGYRVQHCTCSFCWNTLAISSWPPDAVVPAVSAVVSSGQAGSHVKVAKQRSPSALSLSKASGE